MGTNQISSRSVEAEETLPVSFSVELTIKSGFMKEDPMRLREWECRVLASELGTQPGFRSCNRRCVAIPRSSRMNSSITTEARFTRFNCGAVQNWQLKALILKLFLELGFWTALATAESGLRAMRTRCV
jgi:hypothetical protein